MGIQNFPTVLQPLIQQGWLEHTLLEALQAKLAYRMIASREPFTATVGETITKTRTGLRPVVTTPLAPSGNTNFDNGLTSSNPGVEQFVLGINMYGDTVDLNVVTQKVGIANQFIINARQLAEQAARSMDVLAAMPLFSAYMGGNTRVLATLGAPGTTVHVDDIRGFQTVWSATGVPVPVGTGGVNLAVTVNGDAYTVSGATADGTNISGAPFGGISGTLTFTGNVTVADATAANAVVSGLAMPVLRANARATTAALVAGDTLQLVPNVLQAKTTLELNGVSPVPGSGRFHCYLDAQQLQGLFLDTTFMNAYRGAYQAKEYVTGQIVDLMGVLFIPTTMAPQQTLAGLKIRRSIVVGEGALVEADFPLETPETDNPLAEIVDIDNVRFTTRAPMDRLQQIMAQSWYWAGGFAVPTDITANPTVLPTASNAAFKRAVVIESL